MSSREIPFGPVFVINGAHAGRIGYYDDEDTEYPEDIDWDTIPEGAEVEGTNVGIVYFGDFFVAKGYYVIPIEYLREVTTDDLMRRREELHDLCGSFARAKNPELDLEPEEEFDYLAELHYVESVLVDRMIQARYSRSGGGAKIFISYSSKDKAFATWLGTDLKAAGHTPWFDEWDIRVGESIPLKISEGLSAADFVIVVLSEHAVNSRWVEKEWHTKYWTEVERGQVAVLPVLLRDCEIPELLKTKKYADFRENYNNGLEDVLVAVDTYIKERGS
jgi:hypothetical protein